jgi:hypothetical protein
MNAYREMRHSPTDYLFWQQKQVSRQLHAPAVSHPRKQPSVPTGWDANAVNRTLVERKKNLRRCR